MGDLRHRTLGRHSVFMPIGIGYIGAYAKSRLGEEGIDLCLYEDPDEILEAIETWRPKVLALANYCWNSQVSDLVFRFAKDLSDARVCDGAAFRIDRSVDVLVDSALRERVRIRAEHGE